ncbi:MAG: AAA family ATPase [Candidatus Bathyarchaeia archaeon]
MPRRSRKRLIIGITGLPGAGKSTAAQAAQQMGIPILVMGDFIRSKAEELGIEPTSRNLGRLMVKLRREHGEDVVAKMTISAIEKLPDRVVVIDGIRSLAEVAAFRSSCTHFKLLAIEAPRETRFHRLTKRLRSDDVRLWRDFARRDQREAKVGVGEAMSASDAVITAKTPSELMDKTRSVLERVMRESGFSRQRQS